MTTTTLTYRKKIGVTATPSTVNSSITQRWPATRSRAERKAVGQVLSSLSPGQRAYQWIRLQAPV